MPGNFVDIEDTAASLVLKWLVNVTARLPLGLAPMSHVGNAVQMGLPTSA